MLFSTPIPSRWILWSLAPIFLALNTTLAECQDSLHSGWDRLLKATVSEDGWVDYDALRSKHAQELKRYLGQLAETSLASLGKKNEKVAFWINAYNALCMQKLVDAKLPESVPHAAFFGKNIFKERDYKIAGKIRSLDDIEHGILRKEFKDPRVHAALVCGASSCPRLRPEAYDPSRLDAQLDEEARRWVQSGKDKNGKRKNYLDRKQNTFYASKIFDWFQEDFGDSDAGVLKFIRQYASDETKAYLKANKVRVRYLAYDWTLNSKS